MPEQRVEGVFRHHGNKVIAHFRTTDSSAPPLGTGLPGEQEGDSPVEQAPAIGHRDDLDGTVCGCKACQKRRTQDSPIRSLRDINARNRQLHRRP